MPSFRITLSYDGAGFVGWQRQAEGVSIQGLLEDALARIEGAPVAVVGAGRTDAGVHALGQVASAAIARTIPSADLRHALNGILPQQIRVIDVADADAGFNARFAARSKTYRYRIVSGDVLSPFDRPYAWHVRAPLDLDAMAEAARTFEGRHDFAAFQASGGGPATSVRTVYASAIGAGGPLGVPGGDRLSASIVYEVMADGFLRHMVRNIVGTLVEVGTGRMPAAAMSAVLAGRDRARAGPTAPAQGLFLVAVHYDDPVSGNQDERA